MVSHTSEQVNSAVREYTRQMTAVAMNFFRKHGLRRWHAAEDVVQEALLALVEGAKQCDLSRPAHEVSAYLGQKVRWHLGRMVLVGGLVRTPAACFRSAAAGSLRNEQACRVRSWCSQGHADACDATLGLRAFSPRPDDRVIQDEVASMVRKLPQRWREILAARYGLDGRGGMTQVEIGKGRGVSRQCIDQHEKAALAYLRKRLEQ